MKNARKPDAAALPATRVKETAEEIISHLRARRDDERAKGVQQYFRHEVIALGIDTPYLRKYARAQVKQLRTSWRLDDAIALCDRLLGEPELEIRGVGLLILSGFGQEFSVSLLPMAERWLATRLDNWALVDSFSSLVLSPLLLRDEAVLEALRRWSKHKSLWVRRAALVTLVPFARRGRHLELAYELAKAHFPDPEDLMHKATGWLLREAGKTDMPGLRTFVLNHGPAMPRTALRYAIERFPAPERRRLLGRTRKPAEQAAQPDLLA